LVGVVVDNADIVLVLVKFMNAGRGCDTVEVEVRLELALIPYSFWWLLWRDTLGSRRFAQARMGERRN
jgi:hypothetical protein